MKGLPIQKRAEFFGWVQPTFGQFQKTCLHYEISLDELFCEANNTVYKHNQRKGLSNLKKNLESFAAALVGNNNESSNSQNHIVNDYSKYGVHALVSNQFKLTPYDVRSEMHQKLSNLVEATNCPNTPSKRI